MAEDILNLIGEFSKIGDFLYFVETQSGNFIYDRVSETLKWCDKSYYAYITLNYIVRIKYKGKHLIKDYCGNKLKVIK